MDALEELKAKAIEQIQIGNCGFGVGHRPEGTMVTFTTLIPRPEREGLKCHIHEFFTLANGFCELCILEGRCR